MAFFDGLLHDIFALLSVANNVPIAVRKPYSTRYAFGARFSLYRLPFGFASNFPAELDIHGVHRVLGDAATGVAGIDFVPGVRNGVPWPHEMLVSHVEAPSLYAPCIIPP